MLKVHHINVGHGDTTFIELPDGQTMLIDCNYTDSAEEDILDYLDQHITKTDDEKKVLDYLVITHPDEDHLCGIKDLSEKFKIGIIWESGFRFEDGNERPHYDDFLSLVKKNGSVKLRASRTPYEAGGATFYCFSSSKYSEDENNDVHYDCLVLRMVYGDASVLFAGDSNHKCWKNKVVKYYAERERADGTTLDNLLASDYLHASHHGSRSFFMEKKDDEPYLEGIKAIDPSVVIVSALSMDESDDRGGKDKDWPPHEDAMSIYEEHADEILLTCDGNIIYEISDDGGFERTLSENVTKRSGRKKGKLIASVSFTPPKPYYDANK